MPADSEKQRRLARPFAGVLLELARTAPDAVALFLPRAGEVVERTWRQLADDVLRTTAYLARRDVQPGDRVVLWSDNRYEWILVDLAIQAAGAIHVPLHGSLTPQSAAAQIAHSDATLVLAATAAQAEGLQRQEGGGWDARYSLELVDGSGEAPSLLERIGELSPEEGRAVFEERLARFNPQSIATILYSSGTTGEPKGVVLTHANLITNAYAVIDVFAESSTVRRLNFLPFSHIYARTCDLYTWLASGSQLVLAQSRDTVIADCQATQPTLMNAVPFFYQKIAQKVAESEGTESPLTLQQLLGGEMWLCLSGGAPLPLDTFDFFHERGLLLLPGYGLTESSPVISISCPAAFRRGAVGKAIPDIEVRFAEDGELLTRGPHVMKEYWKDPELTGQTVRDGWLYTGDLGSIDADGYISITGRKKELIALSTGKKAVPTYLEGLLLREPLIQQAMVIGNDKPCLAALVVPNEGLLRQWLDERQLAVPSHEEACRHPMVAELYATLVCEQLRELPSCEQVKRISLLDTPFTIENGQLTPKLSLRRDVVNRCYGHKIAAMYDRGGIPVEYQGCSAH
jgi:long-chain acyl-CoA synthetase